jgi:hypothetical protein
MSIDLSFFKLGNFNNKFELWDHDFKIEKYDLRHVKPPKLQR